MLKDDYINELVKKAAEFGGDGKIHIIVNNAGFTWDGVIHKVSGILRRKTAIPDLPDLATSRSPTNNGTPSSPSTIPHLSNSSEPLHPTSESKTTSRAQSLTFPPRAASTAMPDRQTTPSQKPAWWA